MSQERPNFDEFPQSRRDRILDAVAHSRVSEFSAAALSVLYLVAGSIPIVQVVAGQADRVLAQASEARTRLLKALKQ